MALTKIQGGVIKDTTNVQVGVLTATGGIDAIGIQSGGVIVTSGIITALNFVGTGNTFAVRGNTVDISISGGAGGGIQLYDNVIDSDVEISLPYKTAAMFVDRDLTVDIESGVTVSVDDGCYFNIVIV
jgi:hypothetical protein